MAMKIIQHLLRGAIYSRSVIAVATIISFTVFLLVSSPEKSRSLLSYTKSVTWNSLWQGGRLKVPGLEAQELRELYECQDRTKSNNSNKCPSYFAWIHEDLAPWSETGISRESMQESRSKADFKATIVNGKLYYERYNKCFQTRDDYTLWGLLMLIERYPGQVPDLELYFVCGDHPQVPKKDYEQRLPPPIFTYCETRGGNHYDIIFPDWSFWGWPEVNIGPWPEQLDNISTGARRPWTDRQPLAHWKGNVFVGTPVRTDLLRCNHSSSNLVVYHQDWGAEVRNGFKTSSLAEQCDYRYKVYAEGRAWSVSLKYITACESTVLLIEPKYWEFFARSWLPYVHYWPLSRSKMCPSIKYAVDWGNSHPTEAEAIARCGKAFLETEVTMDNVYQYMLHLLQGYSKLLKFKPEAPAGLQPMSLDSKLPWHELSMPTGTEGTKTKEKTFCSMPARNRPAIERILARQRAGYQKASQR